MMQGKSGGSGRGGGGETGQLVAEGAWLIFEALGELLVD